MQCDLISPVDEQSENKSQLAKLFATDGCVDLTDALLVLLGVLLSASLV